jgi:hypothetical protein
MERERETERERQRESERAREREKTNSEFGSRASHFHACFTDLPLCQGEGRDDIESSGHLLL